jgi:urease gamma subunit
VWLSLATDSSRLAEQYRKGRVLLAGDAAHVHWAYGGMGLQTGVQDAGNLGWKLAATIQGWAAPELLDTYHNERHAVGERLLMSTRAQEALARPGDHVTALRELMQELLKNEQTFRHVAEMITSVEIRYRMGVSDNEQHAFLGRWAPNLVLASENGSTTVAELMQAGRGVLVDLADRESIRKVAIDWNDRIRVIAARCHQRPAKLDAFLIRPDGYVCWVAMLADTDEASERTLHVALNQWFGAAAKNSRSEQSRAAA